MEMMKYDRTFFDQPIERCGTACDKWDSLREKEKRDLLPMWVADMDFRCPPEVTDALVARAQHPVYGYTEQTEASVEAMLAYMARHHGVQMSARQQITLPCVVTGLKAILLACTAPGDKVLIQTPVYGPFFDVVRSNGRELVPVPLVADSQGYYGMDWPAMEHAVESGVRLMLLCSPQNPVARLWSREELERVYALCKQHQVTLAVDEIHCDFVYTPGRFTSALQLDARDDAKLAVLVSASKTFNLAGLQQATLLTRNPELRRAVLTQLKNTGVVAGNIFALTGTEAAYRYGDAWLAGLLTYLQEAHTLLRAELAARLPEAIMTPQEATYLAWVDLRAYGYPSEELTRRTHAQGVAFSSGTAFDPAKGDGYLRVNFGCPHSQTLEAVQRLEKAIKA